METMEDLIEKWNVPIRVNEVGINVFDRTRAMQMLLERDGAGCKFPGCEHEFSDVSGSPWYPTLDHRRPQSKCKDDPDWPWQRVWGLDNLDRMHRICNQRKGDTEYNEDGSLTLVEFTRSVKLIRPDICPSCYAGRLLLPGDVCEDCSLDIPQPSTWPAYLQRDPRECAHDRHSHCKFCVPGFVERIEPLLIG